MTKCTNAEYRIGTTGTLDGTQTHKLVLEGLFGKVYKVTTTKKLIDRKQLASFRIDIIVLKYPDDVCHQFRKIKYADELEYIVTQKKFTSISYRKWKIPNNLYDCQSIKCENPDNRTYHFFSFSIIRRLSRIWMEFRKILSPSLCRSRQGIR